MHVYGTIRIIEDEELILSLKKLSDIYEVHPEKPVQIEVISENLLTSEVWGIVGFEINQKQSAYKLSQNRDSKDHEAIID